MVMGKVLFLVAILMQIVIRSPYRDSAKKAQTDCEEKLLLTLFTIGGLLLPLVYVFTDWLAFADYPVWLSSLEVIGIGIVIMLAGLWVFWRSHHDLGHNWSPTLEIHQQHALVTQGIYRQIRHPMYSAGWLMMIAQVFLLSNWIAGWGGMITFGLMYFLRVAKEEHMMLEEFGEPYQHYMSQTGRVIPKRLLNRQ